MQKPAFSQSEHQCYTCRAGSFAEIRGQFVYSGSVCSAEIRCQFVYSIVQPEITGQFVVRNQGSVCSAEIGGQFVVQRSGISL